MNELNTNFYQNWQLRKPAVRGGGGVVSSHFRTAAQAGAEVLLAEDGLQGLEVAREALADEAGLAPPKKGRDIHCLHISHA